MLAAYGNVTTGERGRGGGGRVGVFELHWKRGEWAWERRGLQKPKCQTLLGNPMLIPSAEPSLGRWPAQTSCVNRKTLRCKCRGEEDGVSDPQNHMAAMQRKEGWAFIVAQASILRPTPTWGGKEGLRQGCAEVELLFLRILMQRNPECAEHKKGREKGS